MSPDTLIQAVYDAAVSALTSRPNQNPQKVVDQAAERTLQGKLELTRKTRAALVSMLDEWQKTGKQPRPRWASDYDRRRQSSGEAPSEKQLSAAGTKAGEACVGIVQKALRALGSDMPTKVGSKLIRMIESIIRMNVK